MKVKIIKLNKMNLVRLSSEAIEKSRPSALRGESARETRRSFAWQH